MDLTNSTTLKTSSELKALALEQLQGKWGNAILAYFIYSIVMIIGSSIPLLGILISAIISGPLLFGLYSYYLKIQRKESASLDNLTSGINHFLKTFLLFNLTWIFIFLWSLLLIIPGIIAALRYSMAYFILVDNPETDAMEAINQSKEMMEGQKLRLFWLSLSFFGWIILSLLTFGLGFLVLTPYMITTFANFYEELKENKKYQGPISTASQSAPIS